jgi:hypothetical protein
MEGKSLEGRRRRNQHAVLENERKKGQMSKKKRKPKNCGMFSSYCFDVYILILRLIITLNRDQMFIDFWVKHNTKVSVKFTKNFF